MKGNFLSNEWEPTEKMKYFAELDTWSAKNISSEKFKNFTKNYCFTKHNIIHFELELWVAKNRLGPLYNNKFW